MRPAARGNGGTDRTFLDLALADIGASPLRDGLGRLVERWTSIRSTSGIDPQPVGPRGYPVEAPSCSKVDISAMVLPGGLAALCSQL